MNPKVDFYFNKANKWQNEIETLRIIILDSKLTEDLKWGVPCYTFQKKNIVLIHVFKEYCAVLFFKGALLKDVHGILIQQTKNVQIPRQMRFTNTNEIDKATLQTYINEAIELERDGVKVELKTTNEFNMPDELKNKLSKTPALKKAFNSLTPGRQRGYLLYFSAAKQSQTREARIEKYTPQILNGKGLND
jgi:uncharacterized protein YdeI (YjbR/CyaY-like superfamily)